MSDGATKRKVDVLSSLCTTEELLEALQLRLGQLADNYKKIPTHRYRTFNVQEHVSDIHKYKSQEEFQADVLEQFIAWLRNSDLNNFVELRTMRYPRVEGRDIDEYWRGTITFIVPERE